MKRGHLNVEIANGRRQTTLKVSTTNAHAIEV